MCECGSTMELSYRMSLFPPSPHLCMYVVSPTKTETKLALLYQCWFPVSFMNVQTYVCTVATACLGSVSSVGADTTWKCEMYTDIPSHSPHPGEYWLCPTLKSTLTVYAHLHIICTYVYNCPVLLILCYVLENEHCVCKYVCV